MLKFLSALVFIFYTTPLFSADLKVRFTYGSEKKKWVNEITAEFNSANHKTSSGKRIVIEAVAMGSGQCISGILDGTDKAHITSPASGAFFTLGNDKSQKASGKPIVASVENLVLSPVVIAMWEPMAEALGWPEKSLGWKDIIEVAKNPKGWEAYEYPEWGKFKFGHTHPEYSNSGLISVFAEIYAATGKSRNLTIEDLEKPETAEFVSSVENTVVHYGKSTGFFGRKMFANGPEYLSAAVLYENMVIESYSKADELPFPVVAIYPKEGTFWSDHPVGIVERPWVSAEHRDAGKKYIEYMMSKEQQVKAMKYGFRPGDPSIKLTSPLDKKHGIDIAQPKTTLEVPGADVIEKSIQLWQKCKKKANIVIVLDKSGSMKTDGRMNGAKSGAQEMLSMLNDKDTVSVLSFSDKLSWMVKSKLVKDEREKVKKRVKALFPGGGTALYDATLEAFNYLQDNKKENSISAVVILTDGADTNSKNKLESLIRLIKTDYETKNTRVFTIGYGSGAQADKLKAISDATAAKDYIGDTENIKKIFQEISTFF